MFYIRVDGNTKIGAGHIMRCLSIAEALKNRGQVTIFITADEESAKLIGSKGFATLTLGTQYDDMESEIPKLLSVLKESQIQLLLIDSYQVTDTYMREIGKVAKIVYMDDLGEHCYPVNVLVNYNIYAPEIPYEDNYQKKVLTVPKLLLGCEYAPLRAEFQCMESKVRRTVRDVLITTGGSDPFNAAGKISKRLVTAGAKYRGLQFHIVSGAFNKHTDCLHKLARENTNFHVYENVRHMADLMKKCDVAIAACGSTMYELASLGVPAVGFFFADNQKLVAEAFGKKLCKNAGNISENEQDTMDKILQYLDEYIASYEERNAACEEMIQMLDGDGASRIADNLMKV